jgi:hypothetical protein
LLTLLPMFAAPAYAVTAGAFDITFTSDGSDPTLGTHFSYAGNTLTILQGDDYTISMASLGAITTDRIVVQQGLTGVNITLNGVKIDRSADPSGTDAAAAFNMSGATVNLTLEGDNELKSGYGWAGLLAPAGATLIISGDGALTANGGMSGAGIGGGSEWSGGNITISGYARVTANGGNGGAGIGGAADGTGAGGTITISGNAQVTANGGDRGAGTGGGNQSAGGTITISGNAQVTANGSSYMNFGSAGIGGGRNGAGGTITISGNAEVTANGGDESAGIGGGGGSNGAGGTVLIYGENTKVTATRGSGAPNDIGAGNLGAPGNIFVALPEGNLQRETSPNNFENIGNAVSFSASPRSNGTVSVTLPTPFNTVPFATDGKYNLFTGLTSPEPMSVMAVGFGNNDIDFDLPGYPTVTKTAAELTDADATVEFVIGFGVNTTTSIPVMNPAGLVLLVMMLAGMAAIRRRRV